MAFHVGTYSFQVGKNTSLLTLFFCQEENAFSASAFTFPILQHEILNMRK
jgi:hypothetical protein